MKYLKYVLAALILLASSNVFGEPPELEERFGMVFEESLKPFYHGVASGDPLTDSEPSGNEFFAEGWYVENGSTMLKQAAGPMPDVPGAPAHAPLMPPSHSIEVTFLSRYETGIFDESAAEIVAHDPGTQRLFVVNGAANLIDVLSVSDPEHPGKVFDIPLASYGDGPTIIT